MNANPQLDDEVTVTSDYQTASAQVPPNHQSQSEHRSLQKIRDFTLLILHTILIFDLTVFALAFSIFTTFHIVSFLAEASRSHETPLAPPVVSPKDTPEPIGAPGSPDDKPVFVRQTEPSTRRPESKPKSEQLKFATWQKSSDHYQPLAANHTFNWSRPGDCAGQLLPRWDGMSVVQFRCVDGMWRKREL